MSPPFVYRRIPDLQGFGSHSKSVYMYFFEEEKNGVDANKECSEAGLPRNAQCNTHACMVVMTYESNSLRSMTISIKLNLNL